MIAIDKKHLLGIRLLKETTDDKNPFISAKIGANDPTPPVINAEAPASILNAQSLFLTQIGAIITTNQTSNASCSTTIDAINESDAQCSKAPAIWSAAIGGWGEVKASPNAPGSDIRLSGVTLGTDLLKNGEFLDQLGIFGTYTNIINDVKNSFNEEAKINTYSGGIYLGKSVSNGLDFNAIATLGYIDLSTNRLSDRDITEGSSDGMFYAIEGTASYTFNDISNSDFSITPYVTLQSTGVNIDGYQENGYYGATFKSSDNTQLTSILGARLDNTLSTQKLDITSSLNIGWAHQYLDKFSTSDYAHNSDTDIPLTSNSQEIARDSLQLNLNVEFDIKESNVKLFTNVGGSFNEDVTNIEGNIGFKYTW